MFLNSMVLHNFRCFSDLEVNFNNRLTVVVGDNGAGKSTILEAATIAAGTLTSAMDGLTNYGIKKSDAHYKCFDLGSNVDVQPQFPVEITATGDVDGQEITWSRNLKSAKGRGGLASAKELTAIAEAYQERMRNGDKELKLPIISYYGTGRLWAQHREKKNNTFEKNNRSNGYIDSLDGAANDKLMMKWFQKMTMQQFQRNQEIPEFMAVRMAMEQVFASITGLSDVKVQFNLDTGDIDIIYFNKNNEHVRIPVSLLSDGYKCTISLIADIAYRMAILNPQLLDKVLTETEGIILIDEIDLHLHPTWQKRILKDLMNIFPKVQFIVSTHAPEVINSVKRDAIVILKNNAVLAAADETYGKDANTILREVMEVSARPDDVRILFEQFYNLLDKEEWNQAESVLEKLEFKIGNNDAEVNSCRVRLELEQM
ncbi:AAA family ATPase [Frisingicoccus sp.]|uniref:AAA family ATPase n=1 Tax=Frisingicoccus sp. TaxID=1918627 RepID=UPI003AB24527